MLYDRFIEVIHGYIKQTAYQLIDTHNVQHKQNRNENKKFGFTYNKDIILYNKDYTFQNVNGVIIRLLLYCCFLIINNSMKN